MPSEVRSSRDPPGPTPAGSDTAATGSLDGSLRPIRDGSESGSDLVSPDLLRATGIGVWSCDPVSETVSADATSRRLWALPASGPITLADVLAAVAPEHRERARGAALAALVPAGAVEHTVRMARPGDEVWVEVRRGSAPGAGQPLVRGICFDVTGRMRAEAELRRTRREARSRFRALRALYNAAPVGLALFDRDLQQLRVNRRIAELLGDLPLEGAGASNLNIAPDMRAKLEPMLRHAVDTGEARGDVEIERMSPSGDRRLALDCQFYPLRNETGAVTGVGVVVEDVTAFKAAVQARDILSRELSHRIKNLFAVVSSLVTLSARGDKAFQTFARALRGRIEALGRAHDYVRPSEWDKDASRDRTLTNLLSTVLAPYRGESVIDGKPRISIEGPDVPMGPFAATALALTLHELATNAAKYGALSHPSGKVGVTCEVKGDLVEVLWRERGGPPVAGPPEKEGFGSMLARRTFSADLGGALDADWQPEGLVLKLTAPLQRLAR